jgi:hypothetical protein
MKRSFALALLALAACTPAPLSEPAATVEKIYKPLVDSKGATTTDMATIPMTMELALLIQDVESKADGVVFDGDFAGNCQDCAGFSDLEISDDTETRPVVGEGHKLIRADFKLLEETRYVVWDMVQQDGAWKVDNIITKDFTIRDVATGALAELETQSRSEADMAVECLAYLRLETDALTKATPPGDTAALDAATAAWRTRAEGVYTADELAQYLASSVAVLDDTPPAELTTKTADCVAKAQPT